jgi:hypothetical protein
MGFDRAYQVDAMRGRGGKTLDVASLGAQSICASDAWAVSETCSFVQSRLELFQPDRQQ